MIKRSSFVKNALIAGLAIGLGSGFGLMTHQAAADVMGKASAVQIAQSAVSRAQVAAAQARVIVARIQNEMRRLRLTQAQQAQRGAEAQVHMAMDAQQRAIMASRPAVVQAAAAVAQTAAVTAQTRANIAVAQMQIELMLMASDRIRGHRLGRQDVEQPVRWIGEETNTFTLPELRAAILQSTQAVNRAIEQANDTEHRVLLIDVQMQMALSAATSQVPEMAVLAAQAAQADALARASAAQVDVSEVMAQATKNQHALGVVDNMQLAMQANLNAIEGAEPILPTTPLAMARQIVHRAVARSAVARAQTALAQAEVALAQARILKIDLTPFKEIVQRVDDRLRATQRAADWVMADSDVDAEAAAEAAQASASAAVAWSQIAISDIQVAIARATRDDSESLQQLIDAAESRLREARLWAAKTEVSADVAMRDATLTAGLAARSTAEPMRPTRQAVVKAQAQAQVSVAKAQAAMLEVQVAIARSRRSYQTATVAQHATMLARLASKEVQSTYTLSASSLNALTTVSAIVTVAAAVMPTRPRTWYEEEGARPRSSLARAPQPFGVREPFGIVNDPFDIDRDPFGSNRPLFSPTPPPAACGVSCSR